MKKVLTSLLLAFVFLPMALGQTGSRPYKIVTETACGSFTWINGETYDASSTATYDSGDTLYVLDLTIIDGIVDTARVNNISGNCYATFNNYPKHYTESGTFLDTIEVANGCDSVIKLRVTLGDPINDTAYAVSACDQFVTPWKNANSRHDTIKTPGTRTLTHTDTTGGCIHTTTITLTINISDTAKSQAVVEEVQGGCNYTFGDSTFTDTNKVHYRMVTSNVKGCDSIIAIRITSYSGVQNDTAVVVQCDTSYNWNRVLYYNDTVVSYSDTSTDGKCITNYTLDLTFQTEQYDTVVATACGGYSYRYRQYAPNGRVQATQEDTITVSGIYDHHKDGTVLMERAAKGCKTYHCLNLTIMEPIVRASDSTIYIDTCDNSNVRARRFTFDGEVIGPFNHSIADTLIVRRERNGNPNRYVEGMCYDTTIHLTVNIRNSSFLERRVSACDSYIWVEFNPDTVYTESVDGAEQKIYDTIISKTDSTQVYNLDSSEWHWEYEYDTARVAKKNAVNCDSIGKLYLTINKTPSIAIVGDWMIEPGQSTILRAESDVENMRYQWYKNGTAIAGEEGAADSLTVTAEEGTNLDITLVGSRRYNGSNGTVTCTDTSWITVTSAIAGIDGIETVVVDIYPNPASRMLNISSREVIASAVLFNTLGQQLMERNVEGTSTQLDLSGMAAGIYTLRITTANGVEAVRKLIVRK